MKSSIGAAFASTSLAALLAAPLAAVLATPVVASAAAAEHSYELQTRIVEQAPGAGEYDGSLQLRISSDGIVSGYYRPDDNPRFVSVTGGVTGDRFWLEIGAFAAHPLRFDGTFSNGKIDAQGNRPFLDDGRYIALELIAIPKKT